MTKQDEGPENTIISLRPRVYILKISASMMILLGFMCGFGILALSIIQSLMGLVLVPIICGLGGIIYGCTGLTTTLRIDGGGITWRRYFFTQKVPWSEIRNISLNKNSWWIWSRGYGPKKSVFVYRVHQKLIKIPEDWFTPPWDPVLGETLTLYKVLKERWELSQTTVVSAGDITA